MTGPVKIHTLALAAWMLASNALAVAQTQPPPTNPPGRVGRMARILGAWEGRYHRPVYAPALEAVAGYGAGAAIGARFGPPGRWIPLGPGEQYQPGYRASSGYADRHCQPSRRRHTSVRRRSPPYHQM